MQGALFFTVIKSIYHFMTYQSLTQMSASHKNMVIWFAKKQKQTPIDKHVVLRIACSKPAKCWRQKSPKLSSPVNNHTEVLIPWWWRVAVFAVFQMIRKRCQWIWLGSCTVTGRVTMSVWLRAPPSPWVTSLPLPTVTRMFVWRRITPSRCGLSHRRARTPGPGENVACVWKKA